MESIGKLAPEELTAKASHPVDLLRAGAGQTKAFKVREGMFVAYGFANTTMVTTNAGNVIVDTSTAVRARRHIQLLKAESLQPTRWIILTHGHSDHTGGVSLWREPDTQIIAQNNHIEFVNYQARLEGFYALRNSAQFNTPAPDLGWLKGNYGAKIVPTVLFNDRYEFTLGGLTFEIFATPGETPDHLTVWIPEYRVALTGDNYYGSFPNLYTLRGTRARPVLDYINSLNKVLALKPEIVIPGHGQPVIGAEMITRRLTQYRDAI